MRVSNENAREWYLKEASEQNWSVRTLERNISTLYYQRLLSSQEKEIVILEMNQKTTEFQNDSFEFIKNPSVLEFLNLPINLGYTEKELEKALIDNLQKFILELGKGYGQWKSNSIRIANFPSHTLEDIETLIHLLTQ
jgi:predicted nuclease of restriction endonuclease-like (RecB) superfamily